MRVAEGLLVLGACLVLLFGLRREVDPVAGWAAAFLYAFLMAFTPGCLALTEPPMAALVVAGFCLGYYGVRARRPGLLFGAGPCYWPAGGEWGGGRRRGPRRWVAGRCG